MVRKDDRSVFHKPVTRLNLSLCVDTVSIIFSNNIIVVFFDTFARRDDDDEYPKKFVFMQYSPNLIHNLRKPTWQFLYCVSFQYNRERHKNK